MSTSVTFHGSVDVRSKRRRVVAHVEADIGAVEGVVTEELLDQVALVAAADHEIGQAMGQVDLHDVPEDGPPADFDHGLGADRALFADAGAHPPARITTCMPAPEMCEAVVGPLGSRAYTQFCVGHVPRSR